MPNHTTNRLTIKYNPANMATIFGLFDDNYSDIDFNKVMPIPPDTIYWYNARINAWSTKWNAYRTVLKVADGVITLQFDTAWDTPRSIIYALAKLFDFDFAWSDEGEGGWGRQTWENGEMTSQRLTLEEDKRQLYQELKGYDCDEIEE